jgi:hypothetical protein
MGLLEWWSLNSLEEITSKYGHLKICNGLMLVHKCKAKFGHQIDIVQIGALKFVLSCP